MAVIELACRDPDRQAPFKQIRANNSDFINSDYLPSGISLTDPRSMKLDALISFFQHVSNREDLHGIQDAFRFRNVMIGRKKGIFRPARYKVDGDEDRESTPTPPPRKRRKAKKATPNTDILDGELAEEQDQTVGTSARADLQAPTAAHVNQIREGNARAIQESDVLATGLQTPTETPGPEDNASLSPAPRNHATRFLKPIPYAAEESSSSSPRRSPRQNNSSTSINQTSKKKGKK